MPHKCDHCGISGLDADVKWVINPYIEDVNNKVEWEWICPECYTNLCADI